MVKSLNLLTAEYNEFFSAPESTASFKMLFTIKLIAAAWLIVMALANPLTSSQVVLTLSSQGELKLSKRGEGIHLLNCGDNCAVVDLSKSYILLHSLEPD
jgi:hypothetical protein